MNKRTNFKKSNPENKTKTVDKKLSNDLKSPYFSESANSHPETKRMMLELRTDDVVQTATRLDNNFFNQNCVTLAKALLGKTLVRKLSSGEILKGMIVETESYLGVIDMACHSFKGKKTERNEAMFLKPGTAYVYSIYGMYYCFNISSLEEGSAVLIRAVEPLEGVSLMQQFRSKSQKLSSEIKHKNLGNGPSKLCQAFQIEKKIFNKVDLCTSEDMWLEHGMQVDFPSIISCKRIGIDSYGEEWASKPLRFYMKGNVCVSRRCKDMEKLQQEKLLIESQM